MITKDQLNNGHSLSSTAQPEIARLQKLLRDPKQKFTFIVGAGASVDSGLPTWTSLVRNLIKRIDGQYSGLAGEDRDDPMRKAEYVIRMAIAHSGGTVESRIEDALYDGAADVNPGQLVISLCELVEILGPRVSIITTNFDVAVEKALQVKGVSYRQYTIKSRAEWFESLQTPRDPISVMHLHGIVPRGEAAVGPVVLTESHFLKRGPRAREIVKHALDSSVVVFIGVSLTDPNLVGPLWDTRSSRRSAFALTVPTPSRSSDDLATVRGYVLEKSKYLEKDLRVGVIALKSYGQLEQLVCELGVSTRDHVAYDSPDPSTSLHYGLRMRRVLEHCHQTLGSSSPDFDISIDSRSRVSKELQELLEDGGEVRRLLQGFRDKETDLRYEELMRKAGGGSGVDEQFGLSLWLRTFGDTRDDIYSISQVASTSLIPLRVKAFERVPIEPLSAILESRCLFRGLPMYRDLPSPDPFTGWSSGVAVPIRVVREELAPNGSRYRWTATVGAVCLTSSHHIDACPDALRGRWRTSRLAALDAEQRHRLTTRIEWEARRLTGL